MGGSACQLLGPGCAHTLAEACLPFDRCDQGGLRRHLYTHGTAAEASVQAFLLVPGERVPRLADPPTLLLARRGEPAAAICSVCLSGVIDICPAGLVTADWTECQIRS